MTLDDKLATTAITFDDVLLQPRYSQVVPSEVDVGTRLTKRIQLMIPLISSPMDTVTESELAIALGKEGGLGIIHKNMSVSSQTEEVYKVKRSANGIIVDPVTLRPEAPVAKAPKKDDTLVLGVDKQSLDYTMAACCRPIPGDDVFGFVTVSGGIKIHRSACPNATQLLSKYGYRVPKARWAGQKERSESRATATIAFSGVDDIGLVNHITGIISADMSVDM